MPSILPTVKLPPTRLNPKIIVTYGMSKVGKTTALTELDSCLIEDYEQGATSMHSLRVPITSITNTSFYNKISNPNSKPIINPDGTIKAMSYDHVIENIIEYAGDWKAANPGKGNPPFPYRRIAIDTLDKFEDMCIISATEKYKARYPTFDGKDIFDIAKGGGYYHLRNEVLERIETLSGFCETLILVAHTKEKITDKGGIEVTSQDINLTGRLSGMVCAKADIIMYLYREQNKPLMASLETREGVVMGTRDFPHLKPLMGTKFEFSWDKILVDPAKVV